MAIDVLFNLLPSKPNINLVIIKKIKKIKVIVIPIINNTPLISLKRMESKKMIKTEKKNDIRRQKQGSKSLRPTFSYRIKKINKEGA